jgi:curved DNA-binding protein CbpA
MSRAGFDKDYYGILGLGPEATDDQIRRTYRRLALRWHPDRNAGDREAGERFKEISEAYAVLIDPSKRRQYDRARDSGRTADFGQTREDIFRDLFANPVASSIFEELARELARSGMRVDRHYFHQTLFGGRTVVSGGVIIVTPFTPVLAMFKLARAVLRGARAAGRLEREAGPARHARPREIDREHRPRGILGRLATIGRALLAGSSLPSADGVDVTLPLPLTPSEAEKGCRKRVMLNRTTGLDELMVTVPPGVRAGTKLRLRGKGRADRGRPPGDVYLTVEIANGR